MPDFKSCISEAADKGEIHADVAELAHATYDEAYAAASQSLGPVDADRAAAQAVMDKLTFEQMEARRRQTLMIRSRRRVLEGIAGYKDRRGYQDVKPLGGGGGRPPKDGWFQGGEPPKDGPGSGGGAAARALELIVENKPGLSGGPFPSVAGRFRAIRGEFDANMAAVIEKFETKFGYDKPGRATLDNVVREAFGEDTGDAPSKMLAQAWAETADRARVMFNNAGGHIPELKDWGMPQWTDPVKARALGKDGWVERVFGDLDRQRMIDRSTKAPLSDNRLKALLRDAYDSIASGGAVDRSPGQGLGHGALGTQRAEHRFLTFKDADTWLRYQQDLGEGDPFQAMMGHLDDMANDIARMQILGPNPDFQFDWLKNFAMREAQIEEGKGLDKAASRARSYIKTADDMMAAFKGTSNMPVNPGLASAGVTARSYLTGVNLGSAIISDVPAAPFFGAMARSFTGLSLTGDMTAFVKLLASPELRAQARRSGFIIEQATDGFTRAARDNLRLMSVGDHVAGQSNAFARRLPAFIMRAQGQTLWDATRKRSFWFEFMGKLHDVRDQSLSDLAASTGENRTLAQILTARGFSEADWKQIRAAPVWEPSPGAKFLRPLDIADRDLGLRVAEMIEMQSRLAVPQTSLWSRAKLIGQERPGTLRGEFNRSVAMFHSFTSSMFHMYGEEMFLREMLRAGTPMTGYRNLASWAAGFLGVLTLGGAASIQLRELTKGDTPRDMTKPAFWGEAMMQGGGLGIWGDFLAATQSRAGKSSAMTAFGPVGTAVSDLNDATVGNIGDIATRMTGPEHESLGEAASDAHVGRDAVNLARRYSPLSSLWWARTAWSRIVCDQLQRLVDPEADQSFRTRQQNLMRTYGSGQWWPEGQAAPDFGGGGA